MGNRKGQGRIQNLTPWQPGQSGNPKGKQPNEWSITGVMKRLVASEVENDKGKLVAVREAIGMKVLERALSGDPNMIKLLWSYMDGMPVQDITSGGQKLGSREEVLSDEELQTEIKRLEVERGLKKLEA